MTSNKHNRLHAAIAALENRDFNTAFTLFTLLAEEESPLGQHFLGWCYEQGLGVTRCEDTAFQLWLRSAQAGVPESQQALGNMYEYGRGTAKDRVRAYYWYVRAAQAGDEEGSKCAERVRKELSSHDSIEAEKLLKELQQEQ